MNRSFIIGTVLFIGLVSGCSSSDSPPTDNNIVGAVVDSTGNLSFCCSAIDQSSNDGHIPQVASNGTNYLVVYEDFFNSTDHHILGALVSFTGTVLSHIDIDVISDNRNPRVTSDGINYFVVYEEINSPNHDIIGARIDSDPNAVLPVIGYVDIDFSGNDDRAPAVAFDGTNYLVVYEEAVTVNNHNILGAFVSPTGALLGGSPFIIEGSSNDALAPALAFDGTNYLVVYEETVTNNDHDIIGARISPAGALLGGSPFVIDGSSSDDLVPAISFDTANYLVVYQETVTNNNHDIIGARVSPAGAVVAGSPFAIDLTSKDDTAPRIAFNGTNHLVVYQEASHDIIGKQVTPLGFVGPVIEVDTSNFDHIAPAVASDGTNYFVVY